LAIDIADNLKNAKNQGIPVVINKEAWYYEEVQKAFKAGYIKGNGDKR
jgi:hypothetical protein